MSRLKYGRDVRLVDAEIARRSNLWGDTRYKDTGY
jgi:hypothetical protein